MDGHRLDHLMASPTSSSTSSSSSSLDVIHHCRWTIAIAFTQVMNGN